MEMVLLMDSVDLGDQPPSYRHHEPFEDQQSIPWSFFSPLIFQLGAQRGDVERFLVDRSNG